LLPSADVFQAQQSRVDVTEHQVAIDLAVVIERLGIEGFDFRLESLVRGDALLNVSLGIAFKLGVVLVEAVGGGGGGAELVVDLRKEVVGKLVPGGGWLRGLCVFGKRYGCEQTESDEGEDLQAGSLRIRT